MVRSLPFRLLAVNDVDVRDAGRHNWHQPGVVEDSEHEPLWRSPPNSSYPQELGLILLSVEPVTIKSVRVKVELTRTPARLEISVGRQKDVVASGHLDAVSRYFSADWTPSCEVLMWEARMDIPQAINPKAVRLDVSDCSFIRLVVHAPHESACNRSHEVVLEDIELLGLTGGTSCRARKLDPNLRIVDRQDGPFDHCFGRIRRPLLLSPDNDSDELQAVFLDAGVPMSIVAQVATIPIVEAVVSASAHKGIKPLAGASEVVPKSIPQDNELTGVPKSDSGTIAPLIGRDSSDQDRGPTSPFDRALRQYIEQTAREKAILEKILATEICVTTDDVASWQSPTISPTDPTNSNEITLYTFGEFFTQCLLCGGSDIQVMCVQMAERFARLLKDVVGATSALEGIVALIIIGVRGAKSSRVFRATIHLAHTVFLTKMANTKKTTSQYQPVGGNTQNTNDPAASVSTSSLGLIEEVGITNVSYGLRIILESTLASQLCWSSINHASKPTFRSSTNPHSRKVSDGLPKLPPSIDREFLYFIRSLIEQDLTRASFFEELLGLTPTDSAAGVIFTTSRLRLLRLILRDDMIHCRISTNVKASIHSLCSNWLMPKRSSSRALENANLDDKDAVVIRLASECLNEIDRSSSISQQAKDNANLVKGLLVAVPKHLQVASILNRHRSNCHYHTADFVQDPLTELEIAEFAKQMQRYFSSQPRPSALYRHVFVRAPQIIIEKDEMEQCELFQKGNITFQGQVVARTPPKETFHEEIQRNAASFVFDVGTPSSTKVAGTAPPHHQEVVSSFAAFRGTIEQRSDPPKQTRKVSPEDHLQPPKTTKTLAVTSNQPGKNAVSTATMIVSSDATSAAAAKSSVQVVEDSTNIADNTLLQEVPAVAPTTSTDSVLLPVAVTQDPTKQKAIPYQPERAKVKGKEKRKVKSGAKDQDNCVLQ